MSTQQPEALLIAAWLRKSNEEAMAWRIDGAEAIERQHAHIEALETSEQQHMQELRSYRITVENREARIAELEAQLIAEAARTAEQKLRADQMEKQHAMQAKMHAQAAEQLAAAKQGVPEGWVCVPVRPSAKMIYAYTNAASPYKAYAAMLAEAPKLTSYHPTPQGLDAQQGVRNRMLVDAGALQMVVNALRRDASEGRPSRGEMADELLLSATRPTPQGRSITDALEARVQDRLDRLYLALEVCSAELFAQCADQGRAMKYVDQARYALAAEQCARAAQAKQGGVA